MFRRILVPLDATPFSERALAHVRRLLKREDAVVELLTVVPPLGRETTSDPEEGERFVTLRLEHARRRLKELAQGLEEQGATVRWDARLGDPADQILRRTEEEPPVSLVAMATHGRTGPVRWIRGSVAERVLRHANVPLLLCNPSEEGEGDAAPRFRKILVPLDGSDNSAAILPLAEEFARLYESELVLCRVGALAATAVPYGEMLGPPVMLPELEEGLAPFVDRLKDQGLQVTTHVSLGDPASEILAAVDRLEVDLVAMTTHGHTGVDRWLFGSVAENVLRHCRVPLLVKRVRALRAQREAG
ncbi:MAG: universal stress protein [Planctomycetota bacterium]|nr:MAG: universal stress protein [Planctomycetota bacterium]